MRRLPKISVLYWAHLCLKCFFGISNFLEEISSLSHSILSLHFFALITEEGFLISPCYSFFFLNIYILLKYSWLIMFHVHSKVIQLYIAFKCVYLSFPPLPFASFLFTAICKASSDNHFAVLHLFFLGMVLITASCTTSRTSVHNSSGTLSIRSNPLNLFVTSTV